jgi:hypothetical protein
MSKALALLFSPKDKPRLLFVETLNEMSQEAERAGSTWCLVSARHDTLAALAGGVLVVSVGDLSKSMLENNLSHYKALALGHLCLQHGEFTSDIFIDGRFPSALETVAELAGRAFADQIGDSMKESDARRLVTEMLEAASQLVDCPCVTEHLAAITATSSESGFRFIMPPSHKPGLPN